MGRGGHRVPFPPMTEHFILPDGEPAPCGYCGAPVPRKWFGLEVQQPRPRVPGSHLDDWQWHDVIFCSQDHAARWLAVPLPTPEPRVVALKVASNWGERVEWALIFGAVFVVVGLAVIGGFAVVRYILSMD